MKIKIICVGQLKEKYLVMLVEQLKSQITTQVNLSIIELKDEPGNDKNANAQIEQIKQIEGERILKQISNDDYVVSLAIEGEILTTTTFNKLVTKATNLDKTIVFIIGGSYGLSNAVYQASHQLVSFSRMTFPHQLMRLFILDIIEKNF